MHMHLLKAQIPAQLQILMFSTVQLVAVYLPVGITKIDYRNEERGREKSKRASERPEQKDCDWKE